MNFRRLLSLLAFFAFAGALCALDRTAPAPARAASAKPAPDEPIDFTRQIQPLLSENCFFCHGPDAAQRKADLRLDTLDRKQGPFAPREDYSIITPGDVDNSVLMMRITSDDADVHMPPAKSNRHLSPE